MKETFNIIPASNGPMWALVAIIIFMLGLAAMFGYMIYSSRHTKFEVASDSLRISGDIYGRQIPISSLVIDEAKRVDLTTDTPYQPTWRVNGVGLPGYLSGWFKLRNKEKALLFVTDKKQVVYIPTKKGYSLLMSVQNPDKLLNTLKRNG